MVDCWPFWSTIRNRYSLARLRLGFAGLSTPPLFTSGHRAGFGHRANGFVQTGGMDSTHRLRLTMRWMNDPNLFPLRLKRADCHGRLAGIVDLVRA